MDSEISWNWLLVLEFGGLQSDAMDFRIGRFLDTKELLETPLDIMPISW